MKNSSWVFSKGHINSETCKSNEAHKYESQKQLINSFYNKYMFKRGSYFAQWQE